MKQTKLGSLDVVLAGGSDREGGGEGPVVVLLHGFGAPGDDLVSLWRVLDAPQGTRFVFPAAPLSLASEGFGPGRAWWRIDLGAIQRGDARQLTGVPDGLVDARAAVVELLDLIQTDWKVPAARLVLGGFSQGSMLALDVSLRRAEPPAGVVILSGTIVAAEEWLALLDKKVALKVFQSHGALDPILPVAVAEHLRDMLRAAGAEVTWCPFRGAHEIPPQVVDGAGKFIKSVLG